MSTFNIYCDESSVNNPENLFFTIGAICIPREKKSYLKKKVEELKQKHNIQGEIKWRKISPMIENFALDLVDLFFQEDFSFFDIVVDKQKMNLKEYHQDDEELAFYKFYYFLLKNKLQKNSQYYIFLDQRNKKDKTRISAVKSFLGYESLVSQKNFSIKHIQEYDSGENIFIQLADFFSGAVSYSFNTKEQSETKQKILKKIADSLKKDNLQFSSSLGEKKWNNFVIWH